MSPRTLRSTALEEQLPLALTSCASEANTAPVVTIGGRRLQTSPVFDTYWRFAAARQEIYESRLAGTPGPWTTDPVLRQHRFTNCYRAADRVSQYLIRHVAYSGPESLEEVVFRILLFKFFNKIETWQLLEASVGTISWAQFDIGQYDQVLSRAFDGGRRIYSAAYVMPAPQLGRTRKHSNHLELLRLMMTGHIPGRLATAKSMHDAFDILRSYPGVGSFLAFQFLIDINYSNMLQFDEMEFVVPGPGALDGIRKCFGMAAQGIETDVIRYMADHQEQHFERLGLTFRGLRGRRLHLIDCQNLFCEVDKYARAVHPDVAGISGRSRIKQKFVPVPKAVPAWFPPKWGINGQDAASANMIEDRLRNAG